MLVRTLNPGEWVTLYQDGKRVGAVAVKMSSGNRPKLVLDLPPSTQATHEAAPSPSEMPLRDRLRPRV
jgi:hypothetical protein